MKEILSDAVDFAAIYGIWFLSDTQRCLFRKHGTGVDLNDDPCNAILEAAWSAQN